MERWGLERSAFGAEQHPPEPYIDLTVHQGGVWAPLSTQYLGEANQGWGRFVRTKAAMDSIIN